VDSPVALECPDLDEWFAVPAALYPTTSVRSPRLSRVPTLSNLSNGVKKRSGSVPTTVLISMPIIPGTSSGKYLQLARTLPSVNAIAERDVTYIASTPSALATSVGSIRLHSSNPAGVGAELSGPPRPPPQPASARKAVAPSTVRATAPVRQRVDTQVYLTMLFTKLLGKAR
jgi:hypothetical protein